MHANNRKEIECAYSGDIAAAVGFKDVTTGDSLCDENHPIILEKMEFPEPVISVAVEPKTKADQEKMGTAFNAWRKKIRHSKCIQIRKPTRPLFPVWVNFIWTSSLTA